MQRTTLLRLFTRGESELHDLIAEFEVRPLFWVLLDKLVKALAFFRFERLQFAVLEINNMSAHFAKEGLQPILQPLDVVNIQTTGGFVTH